MFLPSLLGAHEAKFVAMARKKSLIKQSEVARAARGLLAAASDFGIISDIEICLATGVVKLSVRHESLTASQIKDSEANEWDTVE